MAPSVGERRHVREVNLFFETQLHKYMQCIFQKYAFYKFLFSTLLLFDWKLNNYVRSINKLFIMPYILEIISFHFGLQKKQI